MRRLDAPVYIARRQRDTVGAGSHEGGLRAVPVADGLAIVHGGELLVGPRDGGVEEVAVEFARAQIQGSDGPEAAVLGDERIAGGAQRVVYLEVVELDLCVPQLLGVKVGPYDLACCVVEVHDLRSIWYRHGSTLSFFSEGLFT